MYLIMEPFVVCICPTYNRRKFLNNLLYMFEYQTYPAERLHLLVLDDSETSNYDIFEGKNNVSYIYNEKKIPLGKKRNMLNEMALQKNAEYIVCLDDDDYYPEDKIKYTIRMMKARKSILSGTSKLHIYYTNLNKIYTFGPYNANHTTNGSMCYHKSFLKDRKYEDDAMKSEEQYFLNNYTNEVLQLDSLKIILCISHNNNTCDKNKLIYTGTAYDIKLKKIIKDKKVLDFYLSL